MNDRLPDVTASAPVEPTADPDAWLTAEASADIAAGIADSTTRAYNQDLERYLAWCHAEGRRPIPAAPETVSQYVSRLTRTPRERTGRPYSPSSIERIIAAIRTSHRAAGFEPPETKGARKVLVGYKAKLSESDDEADRNHAEPRRVDAAVPATLRKLIVTFDRETLKGKRDAALLLLGHAIAGRGSEMVSLNIPSITVDPDGRGIAVRVYRKKIKKWTTPKVMYGTNPATCPVRATLALIEAMAAEDRADGPLFVRIDRHGRIAPPMQRRNKATGQIREIGDPTGRMTADAASDVIETAGDAAKVEGLLRSHSLRRGFVTAARAAGKDLVDIGRHGGWADGSKALLAYIEEDDGWGDSNPLIGIGL